MINEFLFLSLAFFLNGCGALEGADIGFKKDPVYNSSEKNLSFSVINNDEEKDAEGFSSSSAEDAPPSGIYCGIFAVNPDDEILHPGWWVDDNEIWLPVNLEYLIDKDKTDNKVYRGTFIIEKIKPKEIKEVNIQFKHKLKKGDYVVYIDAGDDLVGEKDDSITGGKVNLKSNNFARFTVKYEQEEDKKEEDQK